jgi:hypothetical protein
MPSPAVEVAFAIQLHQVDGELEGETADRVYVESEGTKVDVNLWLHLVFKEKLSLISKAESEMSSTSDEDQQNFYATRDRVLKNDNEDEKEAMLE